MNLKEPQNIFRLLWAGLGLVNRSGSVLFVYIVIVALLEGSGLLMKLFGVPAFLLQLYGFLLASFFMVLLLRILAAKADNFGESFSNSLSASIFPTVYMIILNILLGIGGVALSVAGGVLAVSLQVVGLLLTALIAIYLLVRLAFVTPAIALRDQGPIKAILYSWGMTAGMGNFIRIAAMLLLCGLIPTLLVVLVGRVLYVAIPLYFADSFNLAAPTLLTYGVGGVFALVILFASFWATASFLLFFLNCDYGENRGSYTPDAQANLISQETQVFGMDNNVLPANLGKPVRKEDLQKVSVVKSSVKTGPESAGMQQHLDQVYQPKPEDFVEYAEEDRMPTILFDDDTARQIEANRQMWAKKEEPKQDTGEDDIQTIKMSK